MEKRQGKLRLADIRRVWRLLPTSKKSKALTLLLLMILGMVFEMLSIGLVLPIIIVLSGDNTSQTFPIFDGLIGILGDPDQATVLMTVMLVLLGTYALKNSYLAFVAWRQSKFIFDTQADLAKSLLQVYLHKPYTFHLQRNSSELVNNLQVELNLFIAYMLNPGMLLIAETLVVSGLAVLLFFFEPIGTATVLAFFLIAGGGFQLITKRRIGRWGELRQKFESQRMKHAQQSLGAIKDIKLYGKEAFFLNRYTSSTISSLKMNQRNLFVHNLTRLWLEVLAISGLCLLFVGMFLQGKELSDILPVLGLFAAVSFRLMPSISRIISSMHQLRFGTAVTDLMEKEFKDNGQSKFRESTKPIIFNDKISLSNIIYAYPEANKSALKNISLTIDKGSMVGFIGESGSGKSTLIDIILGVLDPREGQVLVDGEDVQDNKRGWQDLIGYVPQSIYLTDDTLKNNVAFGLTDNDIDDEAVKAAIKSANLEDLVEQLPNGYESMLGERGVRLSGGQRQRIGIARALYFDPEILVFDEATSALDNETELSVMEAIMQLHGKKTILIIAHRLTTVEKCDVVYKLEAGMKLTKTV
jgi:ABC-type multidrug transport system fused ATPase/permease subunit